MRRELLTMAGLSVCLLLSNNAKAACDRFIHTVADGRVKELSLAPSEDVGLFFNGVPGHSYSVEMSDQESKINSKFLGLASELCPTANAAGVNVTGGFDPVILATRGFRGSFTATVAGTPFYTLHIVNSAASTDITYSVSDTTQYNPRWSTFSGFTTQWGFQNTTNFNITGTLKVFTTAGTLVSNTTFDILSGRVVFKTTTGLVIPASQSGNAIFTNNGPPGGIQADAFLISSDGKTVVPAKFDRLREAAH